MSVDILGSEYADLIVTMVMYCQGLGYLLGSLPIGNFSNGSINLKKIAFLRLCSKLLHPHIRVRFSRTSYAKSLFSNQTRLKRAYL